MSLWRCFVVALGGGCGALAGWNMAGPVGAACVGALGAFLGAAVVVDYAGR